MADIKFVELKCQRCGGELLERANDTYECESCNKKWQKQTMHNFTDMLEACEQAIQSQRIADIANLRRLLWKETHNEYVSNIKVSEYCTDILKYLPNDFYAEFYLATCGKNKAALGEFLTNVNIENHTDDIALVLDYVLKSLKPEWVMGVSNFIEKIKDVDMSLYHKYRTKFENEYQNIEDGVFEADLERDVFIAYSSADMPEVMKLAAALEAEGLLCFVAARNMRHGSGSAENYRELLHTAINNCRIFVFVSSGNSRSFSCDAYKEEIKYISEHRKNMPRVEYLIQNYCGRAAERNFKTFFLGLEYCVSVQDVVERVADIIMNQDSESDSGQEDIERKNRELQQQIDEERRKAKELETKIAQAERARAEAEANAKAEEDRKRREEAEARAREEVAQRAEQERRQRDQAEAYAKAERERQRRFQEEQERKRREEERKRKEEEAEAEEKAKAEAEVKAWAEAERKRKAEAAAKAKAEAERKAKIASDFEIKDGTLVKYKGKGGDVVIPDGYVKRIGEYAFSSCKSLTSIIIPNSVTAIAKDAFYMCGSITNVTIPDSVVNIGEGAFGNCYSLTSVKIPKSVISIGDLVFTGCYGLMNINVSPGNIKYKSVDGNLYSRDGKILIQYAIAKKASSFSIPEGVTTIGEWAFSYCKSLTSITIPDGVTIIGGNAFSCCESLTGIIIPNSVISIGASAFSYCHKLTRINLPDRIKTIGEGTFSGCELLSSIIIPNSVTTIGEWAFHSCESLTRIIIPDSVTSIGDEAFEYCENLTNIIISKSILSMGENVFGNCDNLKTIYCRVKKPLFGNLPKGWNENWLGDEDDKCSAKVVWNYKE